MQSEQTNELYAALAKAQLNIENAKLNKINPHFKSKYADLASIIDATRKPLAEQGLAVIQTTEIRDGSIVLVTRLAHSSGQWVRSEYPLPVGAPQAMGSARTYARRYEWSSVTGIAADEDDDANAAQAGYRPTKNGGGDAITDDRILLNDKQLSELNEFMEKTGTDRAQFCRYLKVATLDDLPSSRFSEAWAALEHKWEQKTIARVTAITNGNGKSKPQ